MKGSLIIIGFFILGIICGVTDLIPAEALEGNVSLYALCALMFCVGVSIAFYLHYYSVIHRMLDHEDLYCYC